MKNTSSIALGGVLTALSILMMFLFSLFPFLELAVPAFTGAILLVFVIEGKYKWATFVYIAVSILSTILISNKESMVMYIFFFGYYVIIKDILEKHCNKTLRIFLKTLIFNIAIIVSNLIIIYVFKIPFEEIEKYGKYGALLLLAFANVFFVVYDVALSTFTNLYNKRWRRTLKNIFK